MDLSSSSTTQKNGDVPIEKTASLFRTLSMLMQKGSVTQQNYTVLQKMVLEGDPDKVEDAIKVECDDDLRLGQALSKIAEEKVASTSAEPHDGSDAASSNWRGIGETKKIAKSTKFSKGLASRLSRFATTRSIIIKQSGKEGYGIFCAVATIIGRYYGKQLKADFQERFCMLASKTSVLGAINSFSEHEIRTVIRPLWKLQGNLVDQIELSFCSNIRVLKDHIYVCLSAYENMLRGHVSDKTIQKIKEVQKMCSDSKFLKFFLKDPANQEDTKTIAENVRILMDRARPAAANASAHAIAAD